MELTAIYRLAPYAALRAERFGGLIYRYDNRRLYFLHAPELVGLLNILDGNVTLGAALEAIGAPEPARGRYIRALAQLESLGVIVRITAEDSQPPAPSAVTARSALA
ncbi:MAG: mycofactocin biosynthesis chaperone MftB [Oscillochloridaceae bacterium]|nr:mycofactocin biosynthesis chaperone MftB [Chloroflexaceae bacterium]MDW8392002.1 mycofactocin biosynthesis chaperone MftB [Oscillochloridaceae bacterium]